MLVMIPSVTLSVSNQDIQEEKPDEHNYTGVDHSIVSQGSSYQHQHYRSNIEKRIAHLIAPYAPA